MFVPPFRFFHASLLLLFFISLLPSPASALRFYMRDRERICFKFDAPSSSRVIGERVIANGRGQAMLSVEVKDTSGKLVWESHDSDPKNSKFAFVTPSHGRGEPHDTDDDYDYEAYDMEAPYTVCLVLAFDETMHKASAKRAVSFWIRPDRRKTVKGQEPKAKEGSVSRMHSALQDMQETLKGIAMDLTSLQQRERRLVKNTNSTARRLLWLAVLSICVLLTTAVLQFMHFKTFFRAKKLL